MSSGSLATDATLAPLRKASMASSGDPMATMELPSRKYALGQDASAWTASKPSAHARAVSAFAGGRPADSPALTYATDRLDQRAASSGSTAIAAVYLSIAPA